VGLVVKAQTTVISTIRDAINYHLWFCMIDDFEEVMVLLWQNLIIHGTNLVTWCHVFVQHLQLFLHFQIVEVIFIDLCAESSIWELSQELCAASHENFRIIKILWDVEDTSP